VVDDEEWARWTFDGEVTTATDIRARRKGVASDAARAAALSLKATCVDVHITGPLGFLLARRLCRELRDAGREHGLTVRQDRRLNPRWVEFAPPSALST
jgi:hypothetical protein